MSALFKYCLLLLLLFISSFCVQAQTKKELEKNKLKIEKEIRELNKELSNTKSDRSSSQNKIKLLQNKIKEREKLILNINSQIGILDLQIKSTKKNIDMLEGQIDSLKKEYAKVIRMLYKQGSLVNKTVLIFDSKDFNQAYLRMKYFSKYSQYRKIQTQQITSKEKSLEGINQKLESQKKEQTSLLKQQEFHKVQLSNEEKQNKKKLADIQTKENTLASSLKKKQQEMQALQKQIEKMIADEIRKAKEEAKKKRIAEGKKTTDQKYAISTTPEEIALSNNFSQNKGKLPWPLEKASLIRGFGEYKHESGAKNMNNGWELLGTEGAFARCIFNGVVSKIFTGPNGYKVVIIRHGEYLTVYTNIKSLSVAEGSKVVIRQNIGTLYTNPADNRTEMNFQLWKGNEPQDPKDWLAPKK